jgi:hypothetical protein
MMGGTLATIPRYRFTTWDYASRLSEGQNETGDIAGSMVNTRMIKTPRQPRARQIPPADRTCLGVPSQMVPVLAATTVIPGLTMKSTIHREKGCVHFVRVVHACPHAVANPIAFKTCPLCTTKTSPTLAAREIPWPVRPKRICLVWDVGRQMAPHS